MERTGFVELVCRRAGFDGEERAMSAIGAVAAVLAETLNGQELKQAREDLPSWLAELLVAEVHDEPLTADSFFDRIACREDVGRGFAREHADVIVAAIIDLLPAETRQRLERALPADVASRLAERARDNPVHSARSESTLAAGTPGSHHPVSTAKSDKAQAGSVGVDNPHADSKLSSSSGLTQEQTDDSLATGHEGSDHPISDSDD